MLGYRGFNLDQPINIGKQTEDAVGIMDAESFWQIVLNLRVPANNTAKRFPNLAVVISFLFTIPSSNAIAERLFSTLKLNKTIQRNCLSNYVFGSLVRVKMLLKKEKQTAATVTFNEDLVKRVIQVIAN